ncbi:hypothetical protein AB0E27_41930 [Streptomyces sparsogenes]|uniref:hypothetical protein n=1 Tax=Streptomyces sparsogenes TaxID=67365 RepID=UPI0033F83B26
MTPIPPAPIPAMGVPTIALVMDPHDDAAHTHAALAAHHPPSGRITLHPGPGTTSDTALAHDLLAALGRPPLLPGRFPSGRQPAWEAATAWVTAQPVTRLTVLRAHRLTARRTERLLQLLAGTGIHLTLVCHRPRLPATLHQALQAVDHAVITDFEAAQHYYDGPPAHVDDVDDVADSVRRSRRWITLPALDRLVSYASCAPLPIVWRHRSQPASLTAHTAWEVARRLADSTAHPRLAAALAAALFTGASFQQLATAGLRDYDDAAAKLALHDRARYTDGCAAYPVPGWARIFMRAAACFARLVLGDDQALLAAPGDLTHLLRLAETAMLRPPQPPAARPADRADRIEWDWREQQEAKRYDAMLGVPEKPSRG